MKIDRNGFWGMLYRVSRTMWGDFLGQGTSRRRYESTDLCTFIRSIVVLAPIAALVNVVTVLTTLYALYTVLVVMIVNFTGFALVIGALLGFIAFVVGALFIIVALPELIEKAGRSETGKLIGTYVMAKKHDICPLITLENSNAD